MRRLIVNADDFGRSRGINRGILESHEHGIVTSASLMAVWPASREAAEAAARSQLSLGLHLDLGEWWFQDGHWECTYLRLRLDDEQAVRAEAKRQLRVFRNLVGRDPTHLDSHQHVHREEPARSVLVELGRHLGVPVRHESRLVHYRGDFFGQGATGEPTPAALSLESLLAVLDTIETETTELGCHPGYADDLATTYRRERAVEIATLCDPRLFVELRRRGIELESFASAIDRGFARPALVGRRFAAASVPEVGDSVSAEGAETGRAGRPA